MSRELKFRAWDKKRLEMWTDVLSEIGDDENYDENLSMWSVGNMMETGNDSRFVFMQFSGIPDKHGTPIYEGDIYRHNKDTYLVIFEDFCFKWVKLYDSWLEKNIYSRKECSWLSRLDSQHIEVIGNKFEHSHLLEGVS